MFHLLMSVCAIAIVAALLIRYDAPAAFTALSIGLAVVVAIIYNLLTDA
jgi:hypothetical protein